MVKKTKIKIYKPRNWTKQLHETKKRWNIVIAHRRAGKTVASLNHLIRDAWKNDNVKLAYIAPTYRQAKDISWDILKNYLKLVEGVVFNESELRVNFLNGSRIRLYGAENVDALRGIGLNGVVFDEYSQQPSNIFTEVISKCLADSNGYAIWIGTPKGHNEFWRIHQTALKETVDYNDIVLTIDDTLKNEKGQIIEYLRQSLEDDKKLVKQGIMTIDEFNQEWYCSFEASIKGAYYAKQFELARKENRVGKIFWESTLPVDTWWDIGIGDSTSIWFVQLVGQEVRLIDYCENSGEGLNYYINVLKDKPYTYNEHVAPHDIEVREWTSGQSRIETARRLGIRFSIAPKLSKDDGINAVRQMFNRCIFDETKCAQGIDALSQYHKEWDDKRGEFKKDPYHDWSSHGADAFRYGITSIRNRYKSLTDIQFNQRMKNKKHIKKNITLRMA